MFDIVAREYRDRLHDFEHPWNDLLQDISLIADDFICDFVRKKQNSLQPIQKGRRDVVVFVLFLQNLQGQVSLLLISGAQVASTNPKSDGSKTEECFCDWIELEPVRDCWPPRGKLTSAKTAPYLRALSTNFSVLAPIIGEYFVNNPWSTLSDERRSSAYTTIVSRPQWGVKKRQTV